MGVSSPRAIGNGKVKYHGVDVAEEGEDDEALAGRRRRRKSPESHGKTYVYTCAFFASLNSVLLGYDVGIEELFQASREGQRQEVELQDAEHLMQE
ncbi:hypothetical protein OPV22_001568 [Ensete ventricosum]|uniref:Uncharacterized protein n=1 Tax=Ensete ventricosum TaxID=4639 RepID=A0AAV8RWE8_ENSVE|nr:hypothetical protein OPV22_001568 [Ensete ventricosum]